MIGLAALGAAAILLANLKRAGQKLLVLNRFPGLLGIVTLLPVYAAWTIFPITIYGCLKYSLAHGLPVFVIPHAILMVVLINVMAVLLYVTPQFCENGVYLRGIFIPWHRIYRAVWSLRYKGVLMIYYQEGFRKKYPYLIYVGEVKKDEAIKLIKEKCPEAWKRSVVFWQSLITATRQQAHARHHS